VGGMKPKEKKHAAGIHIKKDPIAYQEKGQSNFHCKELSLNLIS
jgi:hypothetical protein